MGIDKIFWNEKKVLITGNTGFKGSWLGLWLSELGADIKGFSDKEFENNLYSINKTIDTTIGDIRNYSEIDKCISEFQPDIIFHLAAQPLVRESYKDPSKTYSVNLMGTLNLYEAVLKQQKKIFIVTATTDKVYKNLEQIWGYKENDRLCGTDPYSNSKSCTELLSYSYLHSFFINSPHKIYVARAGNVIGGGDWSDDRLIPDIIRSINNKKEVFLRNPESTRPWQHVLEPLYGYLKIVEKFYNEEQEKEPYFNFGPNYEECITVKETTELMINNFPENRTNILLDASNNTALKESKLLFLDCTKSKHILNWHPINSTRQAVELTAEWYRTFLEKKDILNLSIQQIDDYIGRINEG
jgi:CDP-glucose 4,6-dehydratase